MIKDNRELKPKMKVLLISFARSGGMLQYHSQLANALAQKAETTVIIPRRAAKDYFSDRVKIMTIDTGLTLKDVIFKSVTFKAYLDLRRCLKNVEADICHLTGPHPWNILVRELTCLPLFYTIHDPKPHQGERWYKIFIENIFRKRIDASFVHTIKGKDYLISKGFLQNRIFVVPHGDLNFFKKWIKIGLKEEDNILFFGRIEDYKGLDILLQAAPQIFSVLPNWKITIAGKGEMRSYQKWINDDRIEVINRYLRDEEVARLFQKAKMVVLPYKEATQSGVVPIAFAFAKPVIATQVGGLDEIIRNGENGILIKPNDFELLAQTVVQLAKEQKKRVMIGNSGNHSLVKIKWGKIAHTHLMAYHKFLSAKQMR